MPPTPLTPFPTPFEGSEYGHEMMDGDDDKLTSVEQPRYVKEIVACQMMGMLREKKEWWNKINDPLIVNRWKHEMLSQSHILTPQTVEYCIQELRYWANQYQQQLQHVDDKPVIIPACVDGIWQTDHLLNDKDHNMLCQAMQALENIPESQRDYHPGSQKQVVNLVHPSLYCYRIGSSHVTKEPISLQDTLRSIGTGTAEKEDNNVTDTNDASLSKRQKKTKKQQQKKRPQAGDYTTSAEYAWLPTEMDVDADGKVTIASYINNLHPVKHASMYPVIEHIMTRFIPLFESVLTDLRIHPYKSHHASVTPEQDDYEYVSERMTVPMSLLTRMNIKQWQYWYDYSEETEEQQQQEEREEQVFEEYLAKEKKQLMDAYQTTNSTPPLFYTDSYFPIPNATVSLAAQRYATNYVVRQIHPDMKLSHAACSWLLTFQDKLAMLYLEHTYQAIVEHDMKPTDIQPPEELKEEEKKEEQGEDEMDEDGEADGDGDEDAEADGDEDAEADGDEDGEDDADKNGEDDADKDMDKDADAEEPDADADAEDVDFDAAADADLPKEDVTNFVSSPSLLNVNQHLRNVMNELYKHGVSEMNKAVLKFRQAGDRGHAGLQFKQPLQKRWFYMFHKQILPNKFKLLSQQQRHLYYQTLIHQHCYNHIRLLAVIEYFAAEVIELGGNMARNAQPEPEEEDEMTGYEQETSIALEYILESVKQDVELNRLYRYVCAQEKEKETQQEEKQTSKQEEQATNKQANKQVETATTNQTDTEMTSSETTKNDEEEEEEEDDDDYSRAIPQPEVSWPYQPRIIPDDLRVSLANRRLQVIVKLSSIELTPESPIYAGGVWHVEGMKNESIVASGIYYIESSNITESRLSFRHNVKYFSPEQDDNAGVEQAYGLERDGELNQELGSIITQGKRAIAFPNIYQHQVQPFRLLDNTKPGIRKILVFFLVDPSIRIPSTATVPPQQYDWLQSATDEHAPAIMSSLQHSTPLVPVLTSIVIDYLGGLGTISYQQACTHRLALMKERKFFVDKHTQALYQRQFSFCEH